MAVELSEKEQEYFKDLEKNLEKYVQEFRDNERTREEAKEELKRLENYMQAINANEVDDLQINIQFCAVKIKVLKEFLE